MASGILVVQTDPKPGRERDFDDWYNTVHMPEILATPGFVSGARYRHVTSPPSPGGRDDWRTYLAIYEVVADDLGAAYGGLLGRMHAGELSRSDVLSDASPYRSQFFERIFSA
jgi:hypothetical protein